MLQSTPDAERIVRNDLASAVALAIDLAGFYGTGGDQPPALPTSPASTLWTSQAKPPGALVYFRPMRKS